MLEYFFKVEEINALHNARILSGSLLNLKSSIRKISLSGIINLRVCTFLFIHLKALKEKYTQFNNIDGADAVRVSHNAILVSRMHLATIALLCKQTTDNFRTRHPPEPRWRHLSSNGILFVPHFIAQLK